MSLVTSAAENISRSPEADWPLPPTWTESPAAAGLAAGAAAGMAGVPGLEFCAGGMYPGVLLTDEMPDIQSLPCECECLDDPTRISQRVLYPDLLWNNMSAVGSFLLLSVLSPTLGKSCAICLRFF